MPCRSSFHRRAVEAQSCGSCGDSKTMTLKRRGKWGGFLGGILGSAVWLVWFLFGLFRLVGLVFVWFCWLVCLVGWFVWFLLVWLVDLFLSTFSSSMVALWSVNPMESKGTTNGSTCTAVRRSVEVAKVSWSSTRKAHGTCKQPRQVSESFASSPLALSLTESNIPFSNAYGSKQGHPPKKPIEPVGKGKKHVSHPPVQETSPIPTPPLSSCTASQRQAIKQSIGMRGR